ncbi:esterase FE4-like isoform X1 [Eupeodes corollae]|uniref:esterase FE4-like isoform X1 n=1 Tax=Eupeodes corollae TaxID=290404 RepID=UPI0024906E5B|nr:esterase FE4-like isoform X1 [Eupeodes corollae]
MVQFGLKLVLLLVGFINVSVQNELLVQTKLGKIKGSFLRTVNDNEIKSFRGIRYAQAPVGDKRFKAPIKVSPWGEKVFDASKDGFQCPQPFIAKELISEDCLHLSVYTKNLHGNLPVIVYIHGGANYLGSSNSESDVGPDYLLDHDIVLVSLNYRLGALGFLSTKTAEAPGNYGFLDQVMALQWVQDHISSFGGNPRLVTIAGQSSGGTAVTLHMVSPLSKGLFHRAITMSGSYTNHYHLNSLMWTRKIASELACPLYNPKDVINCLRNVTWERLTQVRGTLELYGFSDEQWNYEVDGHFLLDTPTNLFARGDFHKVPIMAGITKDELNYFFSKQENNTGLLNDISLNFDKYAPQLFIFDPNDRAHDKSRRIQQFYLGNKKIQNQDFINFSKIFSDAIINNGVHRLVELARKYVDVFYYRFDYLGRYSLFSDEEGKPRGVGHADDLQYILGTKWFEKKIELHDPEMFMVERITKWWASFAQNGFFFSIPCKNSGINWLASNKTNIYAIYNNKDVTLGGKPFSDRNRFWDELLPIQKQPC